MSPPRPRAPERAPTPTDSPTGRVRAADADRERVVDALRRHAAAGRLDPDELGERIDRAYAARYVDEVQAVLAELPRDEPPGEPRGAPRRRRPVAAHAAPLVAAAAVLAVVTTLTGAWALWWLMWPIAMVLAPHKHPGARRRAEL